MTMTIFLLILKQEYSSQLFQRTIYTLKAKRST